MIFTRLRQPPVHFIAKLLSCLFLLSAWRSPRQFGFATRPETITCTLTPRLSAAIRAFLAGLSSKFHVTMRIFSPLWVFWIDRMILRSLRSTARERTSPVTPGAAAGPEAAWVATGVTRTLVNTPARASWARRMTRILRAGTGAVMLTRPDRRAEPPHGPPGTVGRVT